MPPARGADPIHLNPAAPVADRALLPGDPHRALSVASELLTDVKILNQRRGLWGYTGRAPDGGLVTVQATGMGGPSAGIVAEELIALGAKLLVRIGTCGALVPDLALGEVVAVEGALAADGASRALGAQGLVPADGELTSALAASTEQPAVRAASSDLFYDAREGLAEEWTAAGAAVVEMEAAAIFQVARLRDVKAGCLLAVTDALATGERERIGDEALEALGLKLGETALQALTQPRTFI